MSRREKILLLFHATGPVKIDENYTEEFKNKYRQTEVDILKALKALKYPYELLGIYDDIDFLCRKIKDYRPSVVFNLVERFKNNTSYDQHVASFLELQEVPFTGCHSTGLCLCKDKGLSKKILSYHKIRVPDFTIVRRGKPITRPKRMEFPIFIKPLKEEASYGIAQSSFVENDEQFEQRIAFIHENMNEDAIAEEYIEGREFYVSVIGNRRPRVFPIRELKFREVPTEEPKFASYKAKWDESYRKRWGIKNEFADPLPNGAKEEIEKVSKKIYRLLAITGYARLDLRLTPGGKVVFIEANPNPILAEEEDFAESALKGGFSYEKLIHKIIQQSKEFSHV